MAEEEVVVAASGVPAPSSDLKRKLEELKEGEAEGGDEGRVEAPSVEPQADDEAADAKRPRFDGEVKPDGLVGENGFEGGKAEGGSWEDAEDQSLDNKEAEDDTHPITRGFSEMGYKEEPSADNLKKDDTKPASLEESKTEDAEKASQEEKQEDSKAENAEKPSEEDVKAQSQVAEDPMSDDQTTSRKVEIPNDKVGVLIGKGGETIRSLQYNSGAKIQIMRDAEADPHSATRPVEIIGTLGSINEAEKLINAVIAEADAGGSPALAARGLSSAQTTGLGEQLEMQVPNEKVGLIIGRGGETIKSLQARSRARIQVLIPQHLPEGDGSKERTVRVTGERRQIEFAREMILNVMNQTVRPSSLGGFNQQQSYRPRGPSGPSYWGQRGGPHSSQPMPYDYQQRGYPSPNSHYPPSNYGGYPPQQMGSRGNMGPGWEQRPPSGMHGPFSQSGGYDYYGGRGGHASGPPSGPAMGPPPSQGNYNYGQSHGSDYGHQAPYSHPQQSYGPGPGYEEPKYDNHAPTQHPYGHGSSQPVYPQGGNQPGYGTQQQYGKQPSYGMPSQGPPPNTYALARPNQPGEVPYQGPAQSGQPYVSNVPSQQQYAYGATGPMQQTYPPYGSTDAYNQAPSASGTGYPQQVGQSVPGYGQPGVQQAAGYVQGAAGGYGSYPSSQQAYTEQPAPSNPAVIYQGNQDPAYASNPSMAYGAQPSGQPAYSQPTATQTAAQPMAYGAQPSAQPAYSQPAATQTAAQPMAYGAQPSAQPAYSQPTATQTAAQPAEYDQSVPQQSGYAVAPTSAPAGYGKTLSPQPATYPQYDSTQMYAAPH